VFTRGCIASSLSGAPIRMQGTADREDGRRELYRAAFIRVSLESEPTAALCAGRVQLPRGRQDVTSVVGFGHYCGNWRCLILELAGGGQAPNSGNLEVPDFVRWRGGRS
jgi:hypothetical protein